MRKEDKKKVRKAICFYENILKADIDLFQQRLFLMLLWDYLTSSLRDDPFLENLAKLFCGSYEDGEEELFYTTLEAEICILDLIKNYKDVLAFDVYDSCFVSKDNIREELIKEYDMHPEEDFVDAVYKQLYNEYTSIIAIEVTSVPKDAEPRPFWLPVISSYELGHCNGKTYMIISTGYIEESAERVSNSTLIELHPGVLLW